MGALLRRATIALILVVWFFPPAPVQAAGVRRPVATQRGTPASATEVAGYAERERQAGNLERFEGGARISITTTALIIILLLVIILLILL